MPDIIETTDAAAATSTAYSLSIGQTAQGTIGALGDHDWYRVNLTAGQTYTLAMVGTGVNNVQDPYLRLYDASGTTLLASNDDGLPGNNSILTFTASTTGAYYIDAGAYNDGGAGQYGVSLTTGSRASFDILMGAGVIDTDLSWSASAGTGATVTVGFRMTDDGLEPNFAQFTSQQMAAVMTILQYYMDVCGIVFNVVNAGGYTDNATILFSTYNNDDGSGGYAQYPGSTAASSQSGNVHINIAGGNSTTSLPMGSYSFYTLMHELGHAVGLSHPGLYNAGIGQTITYASNAQFTQDTHQYTVMSYFDESYTTGTGYGGYADGLMLFDVYALQQIYGANTTTRIGDTVYGFNSTAGNNLFNFAANTNPSFCLWDAGGTDTLDCSGYSATQSISLINGTFSNIGGLTGNISIAYGATIENAYGGSGNDSIYLSSQNVNNLINGNGGTDTVYVTYSYGSGYSIQLGSTANNLVMLGSAGTDTFQNCDYVHFADGTTVTTASLLGSTTSAAPHDFNGDGTSDMLIRHAASGYVSYGQMNSGAVTAWRGITGLPTDWSAVDAGDFDGDGRSDDILVHNPTGGWVSFGKTENGALQSWNSLTRLTTDWKVVGAGDFDGDGRADDILVHNASLGYVSFGKTENGTLQSWTGITYLPSGWQVVGVGDFDGDSRIDDILVYNASQGWVSVGRTQNGTLQSWTGVAQLPSDWQAVGAGDFDADGRADDILVRHTSGYVSYGQTQDLSLQTWRGITGLSTDWLVVT
jgi:serralysin